MGPRAAPLRPQGETPAREGGPGCPPSRVSRMRSSSLEARARGPGPPRSVRTLPRGPRREAGSREPASGCPGALPPRARMPFLARSRAPGPGPPSRERQKRPPERPPRASQDPKRGPRGRLPRAGPPRRPARPAPESRPFLLPRAGFWALGSPETPLLALLKVRGHGPRAARLARREPSSQPPEGRAERQGGRARVYTRREGSAQVPGVPGYVYMVHGPPGPCTTVHSRVHHAPSYRRPCWYRPAAPTRRAVTEPWAQSGRTRWAASFLCASAHRSVAVPMSARARARGARGPDWIKIG